MHPNLCASVELLYKWASWKSTNCAMFTVPPNLGLIGKGGSEIDWKKTQVYPSITVQGVSKPWGLISNLKNMYHERLFEARWNCIQVLQVSCANHKPMNQWVPHIRWNRQIDKSQYSVKPTKAISFRRRTMWKTTALRMWNTTIDFIKSYMNPLESSCMLHRTGWIRNSKRTESTKQTDSSAVALLVPISLAFFLFSYVFFISNYANVLQTYL